MNEYDITEAFRKIENELIASMIRNMDRHRAEEDKEGKEWSMWQAEQLKALEKYKVENQKKYPKQFKKINQSVAALISEARERGSMEQEIEILEAVQNGFKGMRKISRGMTGEFFKLNERKLEALIKATVSDMEKAEVAILRMANDQYRKVIFSAQVYANSGAGTYEKAVDMATRDMLAAGLNCVEYANGARHTLSNYARMALRTASKRAYLQGEGEKRQEWGISTVIVNKRGNPCPKCLPFVGKVLIDDVWSGGKPEDGPYPLMSTAVKYGLYHPNCKDSHTTYFKGISTADDTWTKEELRKIEKRYRKEQEQRYFERQIEKYDRLAGYSIDPENKQKYERIKKAWEGKLEKRYTVSDDVKEHRIDTPQKMIDLVEQYTADEFVILKDDGDDVYSYDPDLDVVVINTQHPQFPYRDYREAMLHELAHRIDQNEFGTPMNPGFSNAILTAEKKILQNADKYQRMFDVGEVFEYNGLISDIIGCITDNVVVGDYRHDSQYIGIPGYTELEVFANIFSAVYLGDNITVEFIKSELAEVYQAFLMILGVEDA